LAKTLVHTLEPVVGPDHVRASVHVEYDLGTSEDTQELYDPKTTATLTQEHSEENSTGSAPAGVPGTASNVPTGSVPATQPAGKNQAPAANTPPATAPTTAAAASGVNSAAGAEQSSSRSDATTYAVSKSLHRSVEPAGRLRRIAAAVLVDDAIQVKEEGGKRSTTRRKRTADEMKEIEQLARAAIGIDTQRGDVLAVENLSFQEIPLETPAPPAASERWRRMLEPWSWILRYVGLGALFLVVYWLILRPVKRQAVEAFRELPGKAAQKNVPLAASASAVLEAGPPGEGQRTSQLTRVLSEKVKAEPAVASRLVESWVRGDEE
jgi:flagellar M-ring protein FliF